MRCYLDNDALHKLSALGLLSQTLAALGVDDVRVLATAQFRFMLGKPDKGQARFGPVVWARMRDVITGAKTVGEPAADDVAAMADVLGIDAGEAVLFSRAARDPGTILLTGDKRSLAALAEAPSCADLRTALAGRVLCLEQALQRVLQSLGHTQLLAHVERSSVADAAITAVFGPPKTAASVGEGLASYITHLRAQTGSLLAP